MTFTSTTIFSKLADKVKNYSQARIYVAITIALTFGAILFMKTNNNEDDDDTIPRFAQLTENAELKSEYNKNRQKNLKQDNLLAINKHNENEDNGNVSENENDRNNNKNNRNDDNNDNDNNSDQNDDNENDSKYNDENKENDNNNRIFKASTQKIGSNQDENSFSADVHYNPLHVRPEETRRKPNAAFQSIYKIYSSSKNGSNNQVTSPRTQASQAISYNSNIIEDMNPNELILDDRHKNNDLKNVNVLSLSQLQGIDHENNNLPSRHANISSFYQNYNTTSNSPNADTLSRLKEMYAKNTLPSSLKPDSLNKTFLSDPRQQQMKNDANSTILNQMKKLF